MLEQCWGIQYGEKVERSNIHIKPHMKPVKCLDSLVGYWKYFALLVVNCRLKHKLGWLCCYRKHLLLQDPQSYLLPINTFTLRYFIIFFFVQNAI